MFYVASEEWLEIATPTAAIFAIAIAV